MNERTYLVVGAGGTASHLLPALLRLLENEHGSDYILAVIDGDHVEPKNLARQAFSANAIGTNKALALVDSLPAHSGRVVAIQRYITDDNVADTIREGDTVIICADNYNVRRRIMLRAQDLQTVRIINAGNEERDGSVQNWERVDGVNLTPPLSYQQSEIFHVDDHDPANIDCATRASMPDGSQTLLANFMSAAWTLAAITTPGMHTVFWDTLTHSAREDTKSGDWQTYDPRTDPAYTQEGAEPDAVPV